MTDITITGNLGADARLNTVGGSPVAGFSLGYTPRKRVGDEWQDAGPTLWFDVSAWDSLAEKWGDELVKGARVQVAGALGSREHEGKVYTTIRAEMLTVLPKRTTVMTGSGRIVSTPVTSSDPWAGAPEPVEPEVAPW